MEELLEKFRRFVIRLRVRKSFELCNIFNMDETPVWFDMAGNFHSDALRVVERYTPTGPDTLQYEATMDDANVFTRPWTIRMSLQRQKDIGLLDYECTDMLDQMGVAHTWPRDFETNRGPGPR